MRIVSMLPPYRSSCHIFRTLTFMACFTLTYTAAWGAADAAEGKPLVVEKTFYYDGNLQTQENTHCSIDVAADGAVAVAVNSTIGAMNAPAASDDRWVVLLYDKNGEPIGRCSSMNSGMVDVTFGPDGRVYTAEEWFGTCT